MNLNIVRSLFLCVALLPIHFVLATVGAHAETIVVAGFSFSDELGGFRIVDVTGEGSRKNPFLIREEILETGPAVLIIRRTFSEGGQRGWHANARRDRIYLVKSVVNASGKSWSGFQLELRQHLDRPSSIDDGLSFDQMLQRGDDVTATRFKRKQRLYEPADRIKFDQGHVNAGEQFELAVPVTDPTPTSRFYLLQLPEFLLARR